MVKPKPLIYISTECYRMGTPSGRVEQQIGGEPHLRMSQHRASHEGLRPDAAGGIWGSLGVRNGQMVATVLTNIY